MNLGKLIAILLLGGIAVWLWQDENCRNAWSQYGIPHQGGGFSAPQNPQGQQAIQESCVNMQPPPN